MLYTYFYFHSLQPKDWTLGKNVGNGLLHFEVVYARWALFAFKAVQVLGEPTVSGQHLRGEACRSEFADRFIGSQRIWKKQLGDSRRFTVPIATVSFAKRSHSESSLCK